jgi:plastocyanin
MLLAGASGATALAPMLWFTAQPAFAFAQKVSVVNFAYSPASTPIKPGDKIIWVNNSNTKHTVTSDGGGTNFDYTIAPGREEELRFDQAGTYTYHCTFHSQMTGTIEVGDTPPPPPPPPPTTTTTAPPTTTTTAPAPTTTTEPTTTTTAPRPAAGELPPPVPPVPNSAAAPPPSSSTTTSAPSTTTTTAAPPTTVTSVPPAPAGDAAPSPPAPPASAEKPGGTGDGMPTASGPSRAVGGDLDLEAIALVTALVAVGAFAGWTLIRVRPGRI